MRKVLLIPGRDEWERETEIEKEGERERERMKAQKWDECGRGLIYGRTRWRD